MSYLLLSGRSCLKDLIVKWPVADAFATLPGPLGRYPSFLTLFFITLKNGLSSLGHLFTTWMRNRALFHASFSLNTHETTETKHLMWVRESSLKKKPRSVHFPKVAKALMESFSQHSPGGPRPFGCNLAPCTAFNLPGHSWSFYRIDFFISYLAMKVPWWIFNVSKVSCNKKRLVIVSTAAFLLWKTRLFSLEKVLRSPAPPLVFYAFFSGMIHTFRGRSSFEWIG